MSKGKILAVIGGDPRIKEHVMSLLQEGYNVTVAVTSSEAEKAVSEGFFGLVMADLSSRKLDSLNFLVLYKDKNPMGRIIMISRRQSFHSVLQSLRLSASDYLLDPVPRKVLISTVEGALQDSKKTLARLRAKAVEENARLHEEFENANLETIMALVMALDARDEYARGHSLRVSELGVNIGERMSCSEDELKRLRLGGLLHDIGRMALDTKMLHRKKMFVGEEFDNIRQHTDQGVNIVSRVDSLKSIIPIIKYHHEPYEHLHVVVDEKSRDFMLVSIVKVSDAYDAMVSCRPLRNALMPGMALAELRQYSGTAFHPMVVDKLEGLIRQGIISELKGYKAARSLTGNALSLTVSNSMGKCAGREKC